MSYNKIQIIQGDIVNLKIDVIVNAANESLLGGGGVDGAIHRAAGRELYNECKQLGSCKIGDAKITKAYNIKTVKAIVHTVGPIVIDKIVKKQHREHLENCYRSALILAKQHNHRSVAFPCISTGIFSFPNEEAAKIAIKVIIEWLKDEDNYNAIDKIVFCVYLNIDLEIYNRLLNGML